MGQQGFCGVQTGRLLFLHLRELEYLQLRASLNTGTQRQQRGTQRALRD